MRPLILLTLLVSIALLSENVSLFNGVEECVTNVDIFVVEVVDTVGEVSILVVVIIVVASVGLAVDVVFVVVLTVDVVFLANVVKKNEVVVGVVCFRLYPYAC